MWVDFFPLIIVGLPIILGFLAAFWYHYFGYIYDIEDDNEIVIGIPILNRNEYVSIPIQD